MTGDIVERLREFNGYNDCLMDEAADLIESLRSDNAAMREALQAIDKWCCPVLCINCADNRTKARETLSRVQERG